MLENECGGKVKVCWALFCVRTRGDGAASQKYIGQCDESQNENIQTSSAGLDEPYIEFFVMPVYVCY